MVRMNSRRTIRPKRIERSREIYKAVAADAAACCMTPKQFAERFIEQALRELGKLSWISRRAASWRNLPNSVHRGESRHQGIPEPIGLSWWLQAPPRRGYESETVGFLGTLGLQPISSHLPNAAQKAGIVVTSPTRARVEPDSLPLLSVVSKGSRVVHVFLTVDNAHSRIN